MVGSVNRDIVVSAIVIYEMTLRNRVATKGYKMKCRTLSALIGEADMKIGLVLTAEGIQAQLTGGPKNETVRVTQTWREYYDTR